MPEDLLEIGGSNICMNIKELIEWRNDCFFCHKELTTTIEMNGVNTDFSIENNYFSIESKFVNLLIHIETGEIILNGALKLEEDKIMVDEFLQRTNFNIICSCLPCRKLGFLYKYSGSTSILFNRNVSILLFRENLYLNNYIYEQQKINNRQWGSIKSIYPNTSSQNNEIIIPFLDLKKLTLEQLEYKLKTYIVFS